MCWLASLSPAESGHFLPTFLVYLAYGMKHSSSRQLLRQRNREWMHQCLEHVSSAGPGSFKLYKLPWVYSMLFHLALPLPEPWWLLYPFVKNISHWVTEAKQGKTEKEKINHHRKDVEIFLKAQWIPTQYPVRELDGKGLCRPLVRWNNAQSAVVSLCFSVHYYNLQNRKENYKFMLSYPALARLLLKVELFGVS